VAAHGSFAGEVPRNGFWKKAVSSESKSQVGFRTVFDL